MKALVLEEQRRRVCARYAGARTSFVEHLGLRWLRIELGLRPTATSPLYHVLIACPFRFRPHVWVVDPVVALSLDGVGTPHLNADLTLCLFDASAGQWTPAHSIADTTIPWTSRWLFHYEHWVVFREWLGDGPSVVPPKPALQPGAGLKDGA